MASLLVPRFVQPRLEEALEDSPVVLVHGPRQCGKTTLALEAGRTRGHAYLTFDDPVSQASAREDPLGFLDALPERVILDEVQRVPTLFAALKARVDRDRRPGRFLLTGSSNVLLLPTLTDSLAGRMEVVRLHPLAQCERLGHRSGFLDRLFEGDWTTGHAPRLAGALYGIVCGGGFPPALARATTRRRATWYRDYIDALVQRDVRDMARIASLDVMPRLLQAVAGQTAQLTNINELAGLFDLSRPTLRSYVGLLERVFLVEELPAWHHNRLKRLVKTPKLHLGDPGLACALLAHDEKSLAADRSAFGPLLETFVFCELRRLASWSERPVTFHHFRDKDGAEVDVVLERGAREVAGVEVKVSATVTAADFRGLRKLAEAAGERFRGGVVLYDGEQTAPFGEKLFAVPVRRLWEG